ncbi:MAG: hypothetical protein ABJB78_06030 [Betaproteobacteria bacterium]
MAASTARTGLAGATRQCPHCRETILESASVCPACKHHLRYGAAADAAQSAEPALTPLRIEGSIRHPADGAPWEYTVVVTVRNDRGEEIARQLVGVGAMNPNERRSFTLSVEAVEAGAKGTRDPRAKSP